MWLYGSGFPKSLNIGKAVDKIRGNEREEYIDEDFLRRNPSNNTDGILELGLKDGIDAAKRTKGNSEWEGWGTALKPSNEPICLARKPISEKTIADNVLKWKTGGLNIDGCRVGNEGSVRKTEITNISNSDSEIFKGANVKSKRTPIEGEGRFPANIILDEEAGQVLDKQSGISKSPTNYKYNGKTDRSDAITNGFGVGYKDHDREYGDKGGASRFFYQAKVSKKERNMGLEAFEEKKYDLNRVQESGTLEERYNLKSKNNHPTVKPVSLMAYLCKLITPPGGIVLDPFMGSGSTGIAAQLEGFRFCGMEQDKSYFEIAEARINDYEKYREFLKGK
jgi:site-specific DNA-methyltransferase (adenine-specific)